MILRGAAGARYAAGHILYVQGGALYAVPFDEVRHEVSGHPAVLLERVSWNPGMSSSYFAVSREGTYAYALLRPIPILQIPADGSGEGEMFSKGPFNRYPNSWSPDGRMLVFEERHPETGWDLWVLTLGADQERPLIDSPHDQRSAKVSPDARWLAYVSNDSGRDEVYVLPFPGPGARVQISIDGGARPVWARSGRELYDGRRGCDGASFPSRGTTGVIRGKLLAL